MVRVAVVEPEIDRDSVSDSELVPDTVGVAVSVDEREKVLDADDVRLKLLETEMVSVSVAGGVAVGVADSESVSVELGVGGGVFDRVRDSVIELVSARVSLCEGINVALDV